MKKFQPFHWLNRQTTVRRYLVILGSLFALIGLVFSAVFVGMQFNIFNVQGSSTARNLSLGVVPSTKLTSTCNAVDGSIPATCDWSQTQEWGVVAAALTKDQPVIDQVSDQTGVQARMIAAAVAPEQLRYFTANRESFKNYFEPLKILSSLTKFSLGVSGVKEQTADDIEKYANDPTSPFYPGPEIAPLLAYPAGADHDTVLYDRLTDENSHYYSYLYTAVFLKEIEAQWAKSGYDVTQRPDVLVTLFNLGFIESNPNANPRVAGSTITLGGKDYVFGELGTLFYQSDDLLNSFPR
jgi:hypothetical protein